MGKKIKVPVKLYCVNTKKTLKVSEDAVYLCDYGWVCDCGKWTKTDQNNHLPIKYGLRHYYVIKEK